MNVDKYDMHKSSMLLANGTNGKDAKVFKMEKGSSLADSNHSFGESFLSSTPNQGVLTRSVNDDSRSGQVPQQQLFNNFYDKVRDMNSSIGYNGRNELMNNNGGNNMAGYYYDEYDSNSDEEISVT